MNEKKLKRLFAAARKDIAPEMPADFAADVTRVLQTQPATNWLESFSIWDHLNSLFPRVGLAAAAVIVLCLAADWGLTAAGLPGVSDGTAQMASQYLFTPEDL